MHTPLVKPKDGLVRLKVEPDEAALRFSGKRLAVGGVRLTLDEQGGTWLAWEDLVAVQLQLDHVVVGQVRWRPAFDLTEMIHHFGKPVTARQ